MSRACLKVIPTALVLVLIVSCHPEGCYGPKSFGYNITGVVNSNLFGTYTFDGANASVLTEKGFTNHAGFMQFKSDMTFVWSNVPAIMGIPEPGAYVSTAGEWRTVKTGAIWEIELFNTHGCRARTLRVLGESPPHGIELKINHDEGYWIRYRRGHEQR